MPDFGREISSGFFLTPDASQPLLAQAAEAERLGIDYLGIQDHPYQRRFVDTIALIGAIGAATQRIRCFPDVVCLPLRPPAVLAKTAATLSLTSGGRFDLGLGAGSFWDAIAGYGGPRRSPGESLAALSEAVDIVRLIWSGERSLRYTGEHYHLAGVHGGPVPESPIGIWLGVYGPRALRLAGEKADGWVPSFRGDVAEVAAMSDRLDQAAADAGRNPGEIRRVLNISGTITSGAADGPVDGPAGRWIELLTGLATGQGFDTFVFGNPDMRQLAMFATEVIPAVRTAVAAGR